MGTWLPPYIHSEKQMRARQRELVYLYLIIFWVQGPHIQCLDQVDTAKSDVEHGAGNE